MTQVTVNGNTYSDDGSTPKDMQNGGFRTNMLPMVSDTMADTAAKVAAAAGQVVLANAAASAAAISASTAVSGPGSNGTSTTSLLMGLGVQTLTIQTGKTLSPGMPCTIASTASPRNWMNGSIDSYNAGTGSLQVYVTSIGLVTPGVYPTLSAWTVSLSGPAAQAGVINEQKGAPIASATTINLDSATGNYLHLTGSTAVTAVTLTQGAEREVTLDGAVSLINSANLILPTGANIQGAAGDIVRFRGEGGGITRMTSYTRANGSALKSGKVLIAAVTPVVAAAIDMLTLFSSSFNTYEIEIEGIAPATGSDNLSIKAATAGVVDASTNLLQTTFTSGVGATAVTAIDLTGAVIASGKGATVSIKICNANDATKIKKLVSDSIAEGGAGIYTLRQVAGGYKGGSLSGFRLEWVGAANFAAVGSVRVFGMQA